MKSNSRVHKIRGFTLIEAVIYVFLFSSLMVTYMPYAYSINEQNNKLVNDISKAAL